MAHWIAWLLAFAGATLGIGYLRRRVAARYPGLSEGRLDVLLAGFFVCGFLVSAVDHVQNQAELTSLRNNIASAAATVDFVLDWSTGSPSWSTDLTGGASYVAFARRGLPLLVLRSQRVHMKGFPNGRVLFEAFYDLNATGSAASATLPELLRADLLQIGVPDNIPNTAPIESGSVSVTINGSQTITLPIVKAVVRDKKLRLTLRGLQFQSSVRR
ncbi:MAG TPA: hypothetical protein VKW09_08665 [bacterium]|nr:hypothetical protein [bacterium]